MYSRSGLCATNRPVAWSTMLALALVSSVISCGGGDGTPTPPGGFSLSVTPSARTISAGSFAVQSVNVTRTGSFTGTVSLRVDGAPAGVTVDISPATLGAGQSSSDLLVSVATSASVGTYTLTVTGSATGQSDRSASLSLTATPAPGGFTMSASPSNVTIRQGQSGAVDMTITRTGSFTDAVTLAVASAPAGVSVTFTPVVIPATSTRSTVTIDVAGNAQPGNVVLTLRGTGTGLVSEPITTAIALTITPDPGRFTLTANPTALSLEQGQSGTVALSVAREPPFVSSVTLTFEGLPAGVTASPSPIIVVSGATTANVSFSASAAAAAGTYAVTVRGTAADVPSATAQIALTVTPSPGGFTIASPSAGVQQGQVGSVIITATRVAPFTGPITLSVEGAPAGVTTSLSPAVIPVGQTTAQLTFSVLATVPAAAYPITIRGTANGVASQQITQSLSVLAPPPGNVTFRFCQPAMRPVWFGYQDGNTQWTQVAGADGVFQFAFNEARGGVAFVMPVQLTGGAGYDIMLVLGTRAEIIEAGNQSCGKMPPTKALSGTIAGRTAADVVNVNIGAGFVQIMPAAPALYQLPDADLGIRDLVAVRTTFTQPLPPSAVILRRSTDYAANSTIPLLDFSSLEAFTTTTQSLTVTNGGTNELRVRQAYVTAGGTVGWFPTVQMTTNPFVYQVMPPNAVAPGDVYSLRIEARTTPDAPLSRVVTGTFSAATSQVLALGPSLTPPTTSTLQAAPFYQARVRSTLQPEYDKAYLGRYRQPTRTGAFYVTAGFLGGTTVDVTTPDLTAVPGWRGEWGPLVGVAATRSVTAFGWTGAASSLFPGWFGEVVVEPGVVLRSATLTDLFTP